MRSPFCLGITLDGLLALSLKALSSPLHVADASRHERQKRLRRRIGIGKFCEQIVSCSLQLGNSSRQLSNLSSFRGFEITKEIHKAPGPIG